MIDDIYVFAQYDYIENEHLYKNDTALEFVLQFSRGCVPVWRIRLSDSLDSRQKSMKCNTMLHHKDYIFHVF